MKSLIPRGTDRAAVGTWLLASLAVAWFSIVVIRVIPHDGPWPDYLTRWNRWDADRFWWLATYGYGGGPPGVYDPESWPAFFPGYPLAVRLVGFVVEDYRAAGLLISFLAGPIAALALARLADHPSSVPGRFRRRIGRAPARTRDVTEFSSVGVGSLPSGSLPSGASHDPAGPGRGRPGRDARPDAETGPPAKTRENPPARTAGEEAEDAWWKRPGFYAVLAIVTSPCAVFLFAAYSEALFLALAIPAWLLAKKGRWELAVTLAALSSVVRITGLFLALGLIVEFLVGENGRRRPGTWRKAPLLVLPFVSIAAYMGYQWYRTGDMMAWQHAQEKGWNRQTVMPWEAFQTTWTNAFDIQSEWTNAFRVEILAAAVGVLLVAWLLYQRQWPETVYVATQLAAFMTSSFYLSIGRATLLWFPLWIVLGHLMTRHRWLPGVYLAVSLPLMAAFVASFTQGQWTG